MRRTPMSRRFVLSTCIFLLSFVMGCSYAKKGSSFSGYIGSPQMAITLAASSPQRYIAERHKIDIITPESGLQNAWESTIAYCGTIQCELVASSITTRTDDSLPAATIERQQILRLLVKEILVDT